MGSSTQWLGVWYLGFLVWSLLISSASVFLFTGGFLLRRQVLEDRSVASPSSERPPALFNRSIVLVVDALKYEFAAEPERGRRLTREEEFYRLDDKYGSHTPTMAERLLSVLQVRFCFQQFPSIWGMLLKPRVR